MISAACFDLETTSLNADFGVLLCACIKPAHGKMITFRADEFNKDWKTKRSNDKDLALTITEELCKYDILVAHNGVKFDLPFLRTRLARWKLPPPPSEEGY